MSLAVGYSLFAVLFRSNLFLSASTELVCKKILPNDG